MFQDYGVFSQQIAMVIPSTRKGHNNNNALQPNHHNDEPSHHHPYMFDHKSENGCPRAELVSGAGDTVLKLNIGGMSFRIRMTSLFSRTEEEKLVTFVQMDHEKRIRSCDAYIVDAEEYYFERSSILFDAVFKYYATGQLHRPLDVCPQEFANELNYWKIPESVMSTCCWRGYNQLGPSETSSAKSASIEELTHKKDKNLEMRDRSLRCRIHQFCEGDGSLLSTLFTFGSISFVLISVIGLILGSIHEFQVPIVKHGKISTRVNNLSAELRLIFFFRLQFLIGIMNIVDLIAIVPFYLELGLAMFGIDIASLSDIKGALLVVRVLRVLRVVRILKLGRYSSGMRTFALTLRSSARQLGMMGMVSERKIISTPVL
ncbi:K+ channel tetramerization domain protein [Necator americanus]|uniref:K+ channel tetramerization domain protein n=1 Tax=Necator americanus TaxID=51031 RepID=W2TPR5_NECAM|nr:K+ channel tetramerization domain protein [Necator americanus]ETN83674.1 K+ channel tetramerization domain protein [Necator americanus]